MKKQRKFIPRVRLRPRMGQWPQNFNDPRSYVNEKTGAVRLYGIDYQNFRYTIYRRCGGHCEMENEHGKLCGKFASFDGIGHGELSHDIHRGKGGSDVAENVKWSCGGPTGCHRKQRHPGPAWSKPLRAEPAGGDSAKPQAGEPEPAELG